MLRRIFHPTSVHVRIASGCNLGCMFCERELQPKKRAKKKLQPIQFIDGRRELDLTKDMTLETWELVKARLMPHVDRMELGGLGEPTLGKIFARAAKDIVAAEKQLFFFTNGHFLAAPHVIESVGETPHVSVSIDAGTPEGYKRIRGGDLGELIESVTAFKKAIPGAKIDSQFTLVESNIEELPRWVELCARLGIGRFDAHEQLVVNAADHHVTRRIDQSVRFRRDRTLAALDEARRIGEQNRLWLISRLPPFSELNANAGDDGSDLKGFRRWVDLQLGDTNPCDDGSGTDSGGTCVGIDTDVQILHDGTTIKARKLRQGQAVYGLSGYSKIESARIVEVNDLCTITATDQAGKLHWLDCSATHVVMLANGKWARVRNIRPGTKLAGMDGPLVLNAVCSMGTGEVVELVLVGHDRSFFAHGFVNHNAKVKTSDVQTTIGGEGFGSGLIEAGPFDPSEPHEVIVSPKELYVDYDGSCWSCLARHEIGHVATGDWLSIVEQNDSYQAFLAAWFYGKVNDKRFECKSCPRRK